MKPSRIVPEILDCLAKIGVRHSDVARNLEVAESQVSRWRTGEHVPGLDHGVALLVFAEEKLDEIEGRFLRTCKPNNGIDGGQI